MINNWQYEDKSRAESDSKHLLSLLAYLCFSRGAVAVVKARSLRSADQLIHRRSTRNSSGDPLDRVTIGRIILLQN